MNKLKNMRLYKIGYLVLLANIFAIPVANSQSSTVNTVTAIEQLSSFVKNVHSAKGGFTQEKLNDAGRNIDEKQSGSFAFERPNNFKWHIDEPYEQLTLANAENLIQYDPDLAQVIIREASQSIGTSPAAILFGDGDLNKQFELTAIDAKSLNPSVVALESSAHVDWIRAKPRINDAGFDYVDIGFKKALTNSDVPELSQILVKDSFGQTTKILIKEIQTNPGLAKDEFQFEPPADVDIVEM